MTAEPMEPMEPTEPTEPAERAERAERAGRPRNWERLAPAGALGFLFMMALGVIVIGESSPSSKAPSAEIAAWFAENRTGVLLNTSFVMLGAFAFYPWFLAALWRATRRAEGDGDEGVLAVLGLIGGVALLGPLLVQIVGWGAAALEAGPGREPAVAAGLMDLGNMGFILVPIPAAVLVGATSLAARPGVLLPKWMATAGIVIAAILLVGGVIQFFPPLLFALFGLWLVAVAFALLRRAPV